VRDWATFGAWEERRAELIREAESGRLMRELREARAEERFGDGHAGLGDDEVFREEADAGRWKRLFGLLGYTAVPFVGILRE
jgi:hypothetical protein